MSFQVRIPSRTSKVMKNTLFSVVESGVPSHLCQLSQLELLPPFHLPILVFLLSVWQVEALPVLASRGVMGWVELISTTTKSVVFLNFSCSATPHISLFKEFQITKRFAQFWKGNFACSRHAKNPLPSFLSHALYWHLHLYQLVLYNCLSFFSLLFSIACDFYNFFTHKE